MWKNIISIVNKFIRVYYSAVARRVNNGLLNVLQTFTAKKTCVLFLRTNILFPFTNHTTICVNETEYTILFCLDERGRERGGAPVRVTSNDEWNSDDDCV